MDKKIDKNSVTGTPRNNNLANVLEKDIRRRFKRSWINFQEIYKSFGDLWTVFDSSGEEPVVIEGSGGSDEKT